MNVPVRPRRILLPAAILIVAVFFMSCAPSFAPPWSENRTPQILSDSFITRDGMRLPLRMWEAPHPIAVIIALHGMSDYSNAFDMPASWWATNGITTYAYDQRGFGRSPNPGRWPGGTTLRNDLLDFVEAEHTLRPNMPVYVLGESMGGAVVMSALATVNPPPVDGVILVAPAVWSRTYMPASYRAALWLVSHTWPSVDLSAKGLKIWPSDNIAMLRELASDPLFQHTTRADAVYGLVDLMDDAQNASKRITSPPPILFLYGAKDQVIPKAPTEAVIRSLGKMARVRLYADGYHMLLRDLEAKIVWSDTLDWIASGRSSTH